ncbi:alpha/beta hydrolase [Streptomyces clavuligerus]|uniref:alpha/beta hydrolase n=1 Tax=Streptomyces clavuligerus TaxID=1901 RepID=UPI001E35AFD6|nr:alpha/beta hydrolase [Streptomyces clavuligerus]
MDHTHDAAAVRFPDGRLILGNLPSAPDDWDAQDRLETGVRAADLRTVVDALALRRLAPPRIGLLGHSMGGAAAAEAMRQDRPSPPDWTWTAACSAPPSPTPVSTAPSCC